jgi:hypothetical protein
MPAGKKRSDSALGMKTFETKDGTVLVMRHGRSFHVFREIPAKDAAKLAADLAGQPLKGDDNTREYWLQLWKKSN